jgi:hypothetical protein
MGAKEGYRHRHNDPPTTSEESYLPPGILASNPRRLSPLLSSESKVSMSVCVRNIARNSSNETSKRKGEIKRTELVVSICLIHIIRQFHGPALETRSTTYFVHPYPDPHFSTSFLLSLFWHLLQGTQVYFLSK